MQVFCRILNLEYLKEVNNVIDKITHPFKSLAYILLNWNLTRKDLKGYAMRHKFVRFIRMKNNSRNFESRRERTE